MLSLSFILMLANFTPLTNEIDLPIYHYEMAQRIWTSLGGDSIKQIASCYHDIGDIYKYKKSIFWKQRTRMKKPYNFGNQLTSRIGRYYLQITTA